MKATIITATTEQCIMLKCGCLTTTKLNNRRHSLTLFKRSWLCELMLRNHMSVLYSRS